MARLAVVGAGIAGLSAAWELERDGADVVVFEAGDRVGGKLQQSSVPGLAFPMDDGADAFLARVPDALELCGELGIDDLVHPATGRAHVYARGRLRPLPAAHLLGLPTDVDDLASTGLVTDAGLASVRADLAADDADVPPPTADLSVGDLVRSRLGDEVCSHLVEPLLGGINAGEADGLSTAAVAPQIWTCAQRGGSLVRAAAEMRAKATTTGAPVFATPASGMASLPTRLADALRAEIRLGAPTHSLRSGDGGVDVDGETFDGVVIGTPADAAATLLADMAPDASTALGSIDFASVVMVTVVARADDVDHPLDGSGFVVARTAGLDITAGSWASSKWPQWDDGEHVVFRVSIGHDGDPRDWCAASDGSLVDTAIVGLETAMDVTIEPVGARVGRWSRSFPQYRPGHLDLVADIREAVAATGPVAIAGSSLSGIGVPACIRQGREAARDLLGR